MNKKILLALATTLLIGSTVTSGIVYSVSAKNTHTLYKKVDLKFWNDVSNDSHLIYQRYDSPYAHTSINAKVGHHKTHHYSEALIASSPNDSQEVILYTKTGSHNYPKRAEFDFYLKAHYKDGDTVIKDVAKKHVSKAKFPNSNGEASYITGFTIRNRPYDKSDDNPDYIGFIYFTIYYANSQSVTVVRGITY